MVASAPDWPRREAERERVGRDANPVESPVSISMTGTDRSATVVWLALTIRLTPATIPVNSKDRAVAQLGRALGSGPRGRRFESCQPDWTYDRRVNKNSAQQEETLLECHREGLLLADPCGTTTVPPQRGSVMQKVWFRKQTAGGTPRSRERHRTNDQTRQSSRRLRR